MSLHHITLPKHQYTANGQFPVFRDAHLVTELVIRQVLVGERRILITDLIPVRFQRTLVEVIDACSLHHLFTLAAKSLIAHHRHHLCLSSPPISVTRPNIPTHPQAVCPGLLYIQSRPILSPTVSVTVLLSSYLNYFHFGNTCLRCRFTCKGYYIILITESTHHHYLCHDVSEHPSSSKRQGRVLLYADSPTASPTSVVHLLSETRDNITTLFLYHIIAYRTHRFSISLLFAVIDSLRFFP